MQAQPQLNPLHARPGVEISHDKEAVRESAAREQKLKDMRQISDEWDKKENQALKSSSAIYDAQGNLIKRYGGDE